jgi:hypothetical protein
MLEDQIVIAQVAMLPTTMAHASRQRTYSAVATTTTLLETLFVETYRIHPTTLISREAIYHRRARHSFAVPKSGYMFR